MISLVLVRIAVLNVFYDSGDMHDPGWLAAIAWHNGLRLQGPPVFRGPYFAEHVSLIFWITNVISNVVPVPRFDFYAAVIATFYALYAAGLYRLWQMNDTGVSAGRAAVGVVVALGATFSGVGMVALRLPHHEMAIPAFGVWFFIALVRGANRVALVPFVLCLMVREDSGLHLFLPLALWGATLLMRGEARSQRFRVICAFAAAALAYSVVAFLAKYARFPGGDDLIVAYLGTPAWAHVSMPFVLQRLHFYLVWRSYVWLPMLVILGWAAITRNGLLPLGAIATIPWLVLHLSALNITPGTLSYYYGFPFWFALAWPLLALRLSQRPEGRRLQRWPFLLVLAASVVGWRDDRPVVYPLDLNFFRQYPFTYADALDHRDTYQAFVDFYAAHRAAFGLAVLDDAVEGLLIDHIERRNWIEDWDKSAAPDTLMYFVEGPFWTEQTRPLLLSGGYSCVYEVRDTRIRLATHGSLGFSDAAMFRRVRDPDELADAAAEGC